MNNFVRFLRLPVVQLVLAFILSFATVSVIAVMDFAIKPRPSTILSRGVGALLAIGVTLLLGRVTQRKTLDEIGISPRGALPLIVQGALTGAVIMGMVAGLMALAGWYRVVDVNIDALAIAYALILFFFVALFEEHLNAISSSLRTDLQTRIPAKFRFLDLAHCIARQVIAEDDGFGTLVRSEPFTTKTDQFIAGH